MLSKTLVFMILIFVPLVSTKNFGEADLTEFFENAVSKGMISGVHALVSKDGEIVYSRTFGYSEIKTKALLKDDAIYRIASMTKIVTAIAALQFWEKGIYSLDDPVSKYLPEFREIRVFKEGKNHAIEPPYETVAPTRQPTIRDLFRHTAGIWIGKRHSVAGLRNWQGTLIGFVKRLISFPLDTQPGTKFQYGYSIDVLGLLVEKLSGKTLDRYFRDHIFDLMGLEDTGFTISNEKLQRLVNHYEYKDGGLILKEHRETSPFKKRAQALSGGGGWYYSYPGLLTSMDDWLKIMEMIRHGGVHNKTRILKKNTVRLMCSDHLGEIPGAFEKGVGYGLGIGVVVNEVLHGKGASTGTVYWAGAPHNTYFYIDFENKISAAMFMQTAPFGIDGMMDKFLKKTQMVFGSRMGFTKLWLQKGTAQPNESTEGDIHFTLAEARFCDPPSPCLRRGACTERSQTGRPAEKGGRRVIPARGNFVD